MCQRNAEDMSSPLDLDIESACTQMKTLTFNRFSRPLLSTVNMAGWETSQIPLEKKGANGGSFTTLSSARSFHNTLSQDPKIHRSHWKNSTTNNTYNSPYCSTSQWRSSCNDYNHSPSIHGLQEPVTFSLSVLESSYAYALDRGNGQYTRLVPADRLPTMEDLPKTQGPDGLIILPALCPGARFGAVTDVSVFSR